ncbi:MAG: ComEC/Rec2 family competence protein [Pseudomonadota bacterium]
MRVFAFLEAQMLRQRGYLFPWAPVCLALGIGGYFSLTFEPEFLFYLAVCAVIVAGTWVALRLPGAWTPIGTALALIALGVGLAGLRAHQVAGPVLGWRYYGPIEGRVIALDRSASDALRVTLDEVTLRDVAIHKVPDRVRVSLHGISRRPVPGERIMTTGHLSPPQGPVEPGGFDFRRHAWFKQLGAVGYSRVPVLVAAPAGKGLAGVGVTAIRMAASARVREVLPGDIGGFAAAITTGDRSGVSQEALQALRASNLAHLLAISGLHMGLLAGFVFATLRIGLSLIPSWSLRLPVKKLAAIGALGVAAVYLALSGGNVATERAFVMVAVMLGAVLADRRALSLRAVAVAALVVLCLRPESLLGPGFQMSFAATTALVAVFGWLRDADLPACPNWLRPVLGVVISSAVAGLATAPVGAAHFNTLSHYGLPANLVSVPLMGVLVTPAAVLAVCLAPIGLDWIGLKLMGLGLEWILGVAIFVSGLEGARGFVAAPSASVLPMLALGALFFVLWQGRLRVLGLVPCLAAFLIWMQVDRPTVLIAETGGLVGVLTEQGRALSKARGSGFVAEVWLENDGDGVSQKQAATRWPGNSAQIPKITVSGTEILHVTGKRAARDFDRCFDHQIVISAVPLEPRGPCLLLDPQALRKTGSLAIRSAGTKSSNSASGARIWNSGTR